MIREVFLCIFTLTMASKSFCAVIKLPTYDTDTVLSTVEKFLPTNPVIIDSGAFDGSDTARMKERWPNSVIYAFEPVPEIYNWLINKTMRYSGIYCFSLALSNKVGFSEFFLSEDPNNPGVSFQSGSLLAPKEHLNYSHIEFNGKITVPTITIDKWAETYGIDKIDMMWLDLQGMELDVLKASPKIMSTVKVVYTEVEFVEAYEGQGLYGDMKKWMTEQGFVEYAKNFDAPHKGGYGWFGDVLFIRADL